MRVGVIGGGLMGSGIAEVCARSGVDVTVVEVDDARLEQTRAKIDKSLDRAARSGKLEADDRAAAGERLAYTTRARGPRGRRRRHRGGDRERADQARAVPQARRDPARRRVPRLQHLVGADHEAGRRHLEARPRARHALLQPGAGAPARRDRALDHDLRADASTAPTSSPRARSARRRSTRRTAPASSSTRCSSPTSSARSACTSRASPPRRTSTAAWSRAARTRWARSRSPT